MKCCQGLLSHCRGVARSYGFHTLNLVVDFTLRLLALDKSLLAACAEVLSLRLAHFRYLVEELYRVHITAILEREVVIGVVRRL